MKAGVISLAGLLGFMVAGCASPPEAIAPAYVSEVTYQSWTCRQLGEEEQRLDAAYQMAAAAQNHARTNDTIGVIFLGLPVSSLSGSNVAPQIANLKGQQTAVQRASTLKNCSARSEEVPTAASATPAPATYRPAVHRQSVEAPAKKDCSIRSPDSPESVTC